MLSFANHIISSLLLSLLITAVLLITSVCAMKLLFQRHSLHIDIGFILGMCVLSLILFIQSFLFCGASYTKKYVSTVETAIQTSINIEYNKKNLSSKEIEVVKTMIINKYPLLKRYIKNIDKFEFKDGLTNIISPIYSLINEYMWRRVLWMVGGLLTIGGILYYKDKKEQQRAEYLSNRFLNL